MKRIVIVAISLGFFLVQWLRRLICLQVGKRMPATGVVLYYHSIPKEKRSAFAKQMDELIRWSKPVCADVKMPLPPGARYVSVTFDDGYQSIVENALPELAQRRIPTTLFVITEALGLTSRWVSYPPPSRVLNEPIMTEGQLTKLPSDLVQIGSHTLTHPMLTRLDEAEARNELSRSRTRLEEIIKRKVQLFSFPYGAFNDNLIAWCREAGYGRIFTTLSFSAFSKPDEFVMGRVNADPNDWLLEFRLKIFGAYQWLPRAIAMKRRVKAKLKVGIRERAPAITR